VKESTDPKTYRCGNSDQYENLISEMERSHEDLVKKYSALLTEFHSTRIVPPCKECAHYTEALLRVTMELAKEREITALLRAALKTIDICEYGVSPLIETALEQERKLRDRANQP